MNEEDYQRECDKLSEFEKDPLIKKALQDFLDEIPRDRTVQRDRIKAVFDGKPPYAPEELKKAGRSWRKGFLKFLRSIKLKP